MDAAANDSLSTMSLLCTALIASIKNSQTDTIGLHFFCTLHTSYLLTESTSILSITICL
jgi:hypothetical protein